METWSFIILFPYTFLYFQIFKHKNMSLIKTELCYKNLLSYIFQGAWVHVKNDNAEVTKKVIDKDLI